MARFFFFVVVLLVCVTSCYSVKVVDINIICKNAINPSLCSNLLNSNPSESQDLVNLAQYTTGVIHSNVTNIIDEINNLIKQSVGNFAAEVHYKACDASFEQKGGALGVVHALQDFLNKGDHTFLQYLMDSVQIQMSICVSGNAPHDPPFDDTSSLPKHVDVANRLQTSADTIRTCLRNLHSQ
ncbi:unnamed protein product [Lathyrus sativus]|nr:unnamed protein product [Lathyrus sativus]